MTQHKAPAYVVGVDFGTLSGRAVVVRVSDGAELGSALHEYPHAVLTDTLPGGERLVPSPPGPARGCWSWTTTTPSAG